MRRSFILLISFILMLLPLTACTPNQLIQANIKKPLTPISTKGNIRASVSSELENKYRVAYVVGSTSAPFTSWLTKEMQKFAGQYAYTFTLDIFDSQGDSEKQNILIEMCTNQKYDCIIIQPDKIYEQRPYVQKVLDAGIKCIVVNSRMEGVKGLSTVDTNPYEQRAILANAAAAAVPKYGKIVILSSLTEDDHKAFKDIFVKRRPDVSIVDARIFYPDDMEEVINYFEDTIRSRGKFDCVLSDRDSLSMAAEIAVKGNPDFKNLLLYGEGGFPGTLIDIKAGRYTGTCLGNPEELARRSMKAANDLLTGAQNEIHDYIGAVYVDKTNVNDWLQNYTVQ